MNKLQTINTHTIIFNYYPQLLKTNGKLCHYLTVCWLKQKYLPNRNLT